MWTTMHKATTALDREYEDYHAPRSSPAEKLSPLVHQTLDHSQGHTDLYKRSSIRTRTANQQQYMDAFDSAARGQAYFKDFVQSADTLYLPGRHHAERQPAHYHFPQTFSFRPLEPHEHTAALNARHHPISYDSTPSYSVPGVLQVPVDASQYEHITYQDWFRAPTDYQSTSPSTLLSRESSPETPTHGLPGLFYRNEIRPPLVTTTFDSSYGHHAFIDSSKDQPAHLSFGTTPYAPFANPLNPRSYYRPSIALGYPSPQLHYNPYIQHVSQNITSASPDDLQLEKASQADEADDDDNDRKDEMITPASSQDYDHSNSEHEVDDRAHQDELLLQMRDEGISYKDIKRLGNFKEAESTLRGRYRALTKNKKERVRRPQWEANDIALLRRAVRHYCSGTNARPRGKANNYGKKPWKKISRWMRIHGSSYEFAPATCAKKWKNIA